MSLADSLFLAGALEAAARGWRVFPLIPGEKKPLIKEWPKFATTDKGHLASWWKQWPEANVGIATGSGSGLLVFDVDMDLEKGTDGELTIAELEQRHGPLPHTVQALTPRGGRHFYFKNPQGHEIRNSAGESGVGHGLDVRANGGYVVAPPSVWEDRKPYAYCVRSSPR